MRKAACLLVLVGATSTALAGCRSRSVDDRLRRADTFYQQGHYAEAIIELRAALQSDPNLGPVRLKLGDAYLKTNEAPNALREYVRAADLLPKDATAQLKAAALLLRAGKFEDAKTRAEHVLAFDAGNIDAQIVRGNALAGLKDLDGAIAEYEEAIAVDPSRADAYINLGTIQIAQGKQADAEETFKQVVAKAPKSIRARLALANFYWATGRLPESERTFKEAVDIDKQNVDANRALGSYYAATGRLAEAEPYFKAIAAAANSSASLMTLAQYYIAVNRRDEARTILQDIARRPDGYLEATNRLAALDIVEGRFADAKVRTHEVLTKYPKDIVAQLINANLIFGDRKRDEALNALNALIAQEPNLVPARYLAARIYLAGDRVEDATKQYEELLRIERRPVAASVQLARLYLARGKTDQALTYAQQALTMQPDNRDGREMLIRTYIARRELDKAREQFDLLVKQHPNVASVHNAGALLYAAAQKPDAARASYMRALQLRPADLEALGGLLRLDFASRRQADALARVESALTRGEPSADLLFLAARSYLTAGNVPKGEALLRRAIEIDPDRLQGYTLLGQLYVRERRIDEAIAQFRDVLKRNPRSVAAGTMIGVLLESQRRLPEAEQEYRRVLGVDARAGVAANNLAWLLVSSGRNLDEALTFAQVANQMLPGEPNASDTLGWIYFKLHRAAEAVPHLEASVKKAPDRPEFNYHLGMACVETGDWETARRALKHALTLQPQFDGADEARKKLTMIGA